MTTIVTSKQFTGSKKLYGILLVNKQSKVRRVSNRFNFRENPNSLIADIVGFGKLINFKEDRAYLIYSLFVETGDRTERHDIILSEIKEDKNGKITLKIK